MAKVDLNARIAMAIRAPRDKHDDDTRERQSSPSYPFALDYEVCMSCVTLLNDENAILCEHCIVHGSSVYRG